MEKRNRLFEVITIAVILLGAVSVTAGRSEIQIDNAGFERGDVAWRYWGDGDIRDEYYGLKPEEGTFFLRTWLRSGWYQDFRAKKGERYDISALVASAAKDGLWGDAYGEVKIEWRNKKDGDVEVGEATSIKFDLDGQTDKKIEKDDWTEIDLPTVTAPELATHGRVLVTIWSSDDEGGGCVLFDDVKVTKVSP